MKKKKIFFIKYTIREGEHEYRDCAIGYYPDYETALKETEVKHDECGLDLEDEPMSFGDGLTSTTVYHIQEISEKELEVMKKFMSLPDISDLNQIYKEHFSR